MDKLKPCPFCGATASLEAFEERKGYAATVHCDSCLAEITTITYDTEKEAEDRALWAWNRRATDEEVLKSVARVLTKSDCDGAWLDWLKQEVERDG